MPKVWTLRLFVSSGSGAVAKAMQRRRLDACRTPLQNERVDTWLPRLTHLSIAIAVTLFFSNVAWMVWTRERPPIWLLSLVFVFGFVAAVFSHIYNAAHDSMPSD